MIFSVILDVHGLFIFKVTYNKITIYQKKNSNNHKIYMYSKAFKESYSKNQANELSQLSSMTQFIKSLANKISNKTHKKYKFTGNRRLAKLARGQSYIPKLPSYYRLSIIKSRIVKNKPWQNLDQKILIVNEHIKYLTRNEVEIEGSPAQFFDDHNNDVDGHKFAENIALDRHHFRFIVSPENGALVDLKQHARDLVKQMEDDLSCKLQWIGVVHQNTDNPHVHLVVKGQVQDRDLIIKKDYITHGIRARSSNLLTRELGPRTELSIIKAQIKSLQQNRLIGIDYKIAECAKEFNGKFTPCLFKDPKLAKDVQTRIKHLEKLNLVKRPPNWPKNFYQVDLNLTHKLKELAAQHDIYKRLAMFGDARFYTPKIGRITGTIINKGLSDELNNNYYVIIKGQDSQTWYIDLSKCKNIESLKIGQSISLDAKSQIQDSHGFYLKSLEQNKTQKIIR